MADSAQDSATRGEASGSSEVTSLTRAQAMLLEFLSEHDASCPVCGYNLRALTRPVCPECANELALTVGAQRLRLLWLFIAVAPGFFSAIAACFVLIPLLGRLWLGDGVLSPGLLGLDLFGWCSGCFAILLAFPWRSRFLALPPAVQSVCALTLWGVHIAALLLFIFVGTAYL